MPRTAVRWANWEQAGGVVASGSEALTVTFPASPLAVRVEIALGADPAADPATWAWLDITQWVRYRPGISLTVGRRDEASRVEASVARLTLDNTDGRWVRRNPYGPYYGQLSKNTPIRIGVDPGDGLHYRYHGFVNEWPTRWTDRSATDSTVPIVCGGVLRRMQQGQRFKSAMYRSQSGRSANDFVPLAYWPMEDGPGSTRFSAASPSTADMAFSGAVSVAGDSSLGGSESLPVFSVGTSASAPVPAYTDTGQWLWTFAMKLDAMPAAVTDCMEIRVSGGGTGIRWVVKIDPTLFGGGVLFESRDASGAVAESVVPLLVDVDLGGDISAFAGHWFFYSLGLVDVGGGNCRIDHGAASSSEVEFSGTQAGTHAPGRPTSVIITGQSGLSIGHIAVFTDPAMNVAEDLQANTGALVGWAGEMAHERAIRLCREEGVPLVCTSASSSLMGAQSSGTLLDNLRACEAADGGVLYEHEHGLGYQSLDDRLNAPVLLNLDFDSRHVADTPEPADDDQRHINRATVSRVGGSSATVQDDGAVESEGVFETSVSLYLHTDSQTVHAAGRIVHQGSVDEDRWPAIPIRLHTTPDLIPAWTSLPYGARMNLANPPDEMAPDTIDAFIEGWSEAFNENEWAATLNTTPASPYRAGIYASTVTDQDPLIAHYDVDSLTLAADVDTTETSWQVTATPLLTTVAANYSPAIPAVVEGERVLITGCTGGANPQTLTVTRSDNTVVKAHSANAAIVPDLPPYGP